MLTIEINECKLYGECGTRVHSCFFFVKKEDDENDDTNLQSLHNQMHLRLHALINEKFSSFSLSCLFLFVLCSINVSNNATHIQQPWNFRASRKLVYRCFHF